MTLCVDMMKSSGYAAMEQGSNLVPFSFERRSPGPNDVVIDIRYCGICHTDLNAIRNMFGSQTYPLVPGHEITGKVIAVGEKVTKLKVGDWAGVGPIVDSCGKCSHCEDNLEPYCLEGMTRTYGFPDRHGVMAYGGFSDNYVVDEHFSLALPAGLDPAGAAPLLCAGITTYSALRRAGIGPYDKVGIVGLGGLGHLAVKWAHTMGSQVAVFTTSPEKAEQAIQLGANEAIISKDEEAMARHKDSFDYILDTVSGAHDVNIYLDALKFEGTLCLVGMPETAPVVAPGLLAVGRRILTGSMIGGMAETQEMLDYAAEHDITSDIEVINIQQVNEAFERMEHGDVRYRFVIDMASR